MSETIACKSHDGNCEFDATWFCTNPDCKRPPLTSTLYGAHPSGGPLLDKWNSKSHEKAGEQNE